MAGILHTGIYMRNDTESTELRKMDVEVEHFLLRRPSETPGGSRHHVVPWTGGARGSVCRAAENASTRMIASPGRSLARR